MTRAEQLARIPEAISREAYALLIETTLPGIDLHDLVALQFGARSVTAVVFAKDADGSRIPVVDGIEAAPPQDPS